MHCALFRELFDRLCKTKLRLDPSKCVLFNTQVKYPSHLNSEHQVLTDPDNCAAIFTWSRSSNLRNVRSFLGIIYLFLKHIKECKPVYASKQHSPLVFHAE